MIDNWLKALHIIAVVMWISGMLIAGVTVSAASSEHARPPVRYIANVSKWDRRVTSPAMLIAWGLGLWLAYTGSWFGQGWLSAKIFFVLILSGLHGTMSGQLRRIARNEAKGTIGTHSVTLTIVVFSLIVALVVTKPF